MGNLAASFARFLHGSAPFSQHGLGLTLGSTRILDLLLKPRNLLLGGCSFLSGFVRGVFGLSPSCMDQPRFD